MSIELLVSLPALGILALSFYFGFKFGYKRGVRDVLDDPSELNGGNKGGSGSYLS